MKQAMKGTMTRSGAWEEIRRVVRVGGRVLDTAGAPLRDAAVTLWTAPAEPGPRGAAGPGPARVCAVSAQARSGPDGLFFFLDCPAGRYVAQARAASGGAHGTKVVQVDAGAGGLAQLAVTEITVAQGHDQGRM